MGKAALPRNISISWSVTLVKNEKGPNLFGVAGSRQYEYFLGGFLPVRQAELVWENSREFRVEGVTMSELVYCLLVVDCSVY